MNICFCIFFLRSSVKRRRRLDEPYPWTRWLGSCGEPPSLPTAKDMCSFFMESHIESYKVYTIFLFESIISCLLLIVFVVACIANANVLVDRNVGSRARSPI